MSNIEEVDLYKEIENYKIDSFMKLVKQGKKIREVSSAYQLQEGETVVTEKEYKDFMDKKLSAMVKKALKPEFVLKIDNYIQNTKEFYQKRPFFYDKQKIFWFWNEKEYRWVIVDDVEVMKELDKELGFYGQTVGNNVKTNYIEAFKRVGRDKIPQTVEKDWLQFKDRVYSLTSGDFHSVTHDYFFTNPIQWDIGETSDTPTIDKLFKEWVGEEHIRTLYEIIAYSCYRAYPIHLIFCLIGSGRNGKSYFQRLLCEFIGIENICSTELDLLTGSSSSRFESFKLYKKLVCMMGETNFQVMSKTSILKRLTGEDMIGFEMKGKQPFDEFNYGKIIIASNSLPISEDTTEGFYRRWFIVDFPNKFPEGKDILKTIPKKEYSNLARKVIEILPKLLEEGKFTKEGTIQDRETRYLLSSNPLPMFIKEMCIVEDDTYCSYGELYTLYTQWLKHNKKRRIKKREFSNLLSEEGFWTEKCSKKIDDGEWKNSYWVEGLEINHNTGTFGMLGCNFPLDSTYRGVSGNTHTKVTKVSKTEEIEEEQVK